MVAVMMAAGQSVSEQADGGGAQNRGAGFNDLARATIVIVGRRATEAE